MGINDPGGNRVALSAAALWSNGTTTNPKPSHRLAVYRQSTELPAPTTTSSES